MIHLVPYFICLMHCAHAWDDGPSS